MKRIEIFLILILLLVREIYTVKFCLPDKYTRYEEVFRNAYIRLYGNIDFEIGIYNSATGSTYFNNVKLIKCDIAMVDPISYDEIYTELADISEQIQDTLNEGMNDPNDGKIYEELIKDLHADDEREKIGKIKITTRAVPLFMDYGILYYRSDIISQPPRTYSELTSMFIDDTYGTSKDFSTENYVAQLTVEAEIFYNLIENIVNTNSFSTYENDVNKDDEKKYEVFEKETNFSLAKYKELIKDEIIGDTFWHINSDVGTNNFNNGKIYILRNWSSFLFNITNAYNFNSNIQGRTFGKSKIVFADDRYGSDSPRAVNKGIYLAVVNYNNENKIAESVSVLKRLTSKNFMKSLIEEDNFFDIPVYNSLLLQGQANNTMYCERIDCAFFRDLQENQIVATYDLFYLKQFKRRFDNFYTRNLRNYLKEPDDDGSKLKDTMNGFSNYFKDKYVEFNSTASIIMLIVIVSEILITCVITYYIIKYRNFIEIRRSSPLFLILMLIGIILAFGGITTYIGKPTETACTLRPYIFVLAFGLTFFSLLLKTFRIKVIFDKSNIQVKDSYLILYLCILLGIQLGIVTLWTVVAGMKPEVRDVNLDMHYYACQNKSNLGKYLQISLIVINGLALLYGCYLAYKVKNVYSEYNESKVIGLSIYGIVICMVILMFIVSISSLDHLTLFLIESLMIILSADIILVFMFTPKIWKLHINNISDMPYEKQMYM